MIFIDGSFGEGGGQILRTALSLSLSTGTPFRIDNIRAGREQPGLLRQHLTAVLAASEVGGAIVEGGVLGCTNLSFTPRACAIKKMLRSYLKGRRRGGRSHARLFVSDHPVRSYQRLLRSIFLRSRPPLLCKEGEWGVGSANDLRVT